MAKVAFIGLGVMGYPMAGHLRKAGHDVRVYNRTTATTEKFVADNPPAVFGTTGGALVPAAELKDFVASIKAPRRIIILVKAGGPTDAVIDSLVPHLSKGDVIVDGGNALYTDTIRREKALSDKGILFVGSGVSGGEEGARFGPSLMPGGKPESWEILKPIWTAIAAKVDVRSTQLRAVGLIQPASSSRLSWISTSETNGSVICESLRRTPAKTGS